MQIFDHTVIVMVHCCVSFTWEEQKSPAGGRWVCKSCNIWQGIVEVFWWLMLMRTSASKYRKRFSKPGCRSILPGKLTWSAEIRYYGLTGTGSMQTAQPWQWSPDQHLALLYRTSGHQFFSSELPLQFWNAARSLRLWDVKINRQGWLGVGVQLNFFMFD